MGEEEFILLPTSEFRGVDTINLDDVEKILLAKVDWPELSENIRLIQGKFFSILSEIFISLLSIETFLLKQKVGRELGATIYDRLMKQIQFIPQIENKPILLGRVLFTRSTLIEALEGLQCLALCDIVTAVHQSEFKSSLDRRLLNTFEKAKLVKEFLKNQNIPHEFYEQVSFQKLLEGSKVVDSLPIIEKLEEDFEICLDEIKRSENQEEQVEEDQTDPSQKGYNTDGGGGAGSTTN